ncbi:MAG TPA: DNA-binding response regulator [Cytophagales bacterium]|nr:DNA-binding response regulator [Cytophagales bacterium]HAP63908.1 DNA-binding response regulator [Cytophagales bacterium]
MNPIDVLICDDHPIFRKGLRSVLVSEPGIRVVGEAADGHACLRTLRAHPKAVLLLDIVMPHMDGIACLTELRTRQADTTVIALTQFDEKRLIKQMLRLGAQGYLLKQTDYEELVKACQRVARGKTYYSEAVNEQLRTNKDEPVENALFPDLQPREREVLWRICAEQSSKQIAAYMEISIKTVENHRTTLFKKLGVSNLAGLVKWAVLNEYDLPPGTA